MCSYSPETKTTDCYKCTYETEDKLDMKAHLKSHLPKRRYINGIQDDRGTFYKCPQDNCLFISLNTHGKKINCFTCGEVFDSIQAYRRHTRLKHKERDSYKCNACPFLSEEWSKYERHVAKHKDKVLQCRFCPHKTRYKRDLVKHQHAHKQNQVYNCHDCSYSTKVKQRLKKHMLVHMSDSRSIWYKCGKESSVVRLEGALKLLSKMCSYSPETKTTHCYKCTYETKDKLDLKAHLKSHLPKLRYHGIRGDRGNFYKCPQENCLFISRNHTNIIVAHSKTHGKKIHCFICGEICESYEAYRRHIRQEHKVGDSYKCYACPFLSKRRDQYKRHVVKHNGQLLQCHSCSYETRYKKNMCKHQYLHSSNEVYYCHNCSYSTKVKAALRIHVLVHMSLSRSVLFKCEKCEFSTKYHTCLQKHRKRIHSQNPQYTCDFCQDKFKYERLRRLHILQFHGPNDEVRKKYIKQCPNCDYETYNVGYLKKHIEIVHGTADGNAFIQCKKCDFESVYDSSVRNHFKRKHAKRKK
ncbi:unnamed protein product [Phaedon cochleariae]|uniref:C2H2-type domain-containing protein n=1 Tax=Phaedon cochleariae TaxID=80249 RepID=A0A9N9SCS5_PHACE|nr:unnamed protein product [Phaedon cochleariae]